LDPTGRKGETQTDRRPITPRQGEGGAYSRHVSPQAAAKRRISGTAQRRPARSRHHQRFNSEWDIANERGTYLFLDAAGQHRRQRHRVNIYDKSLTKGWS